MTIVYLNPTSGLGGAERCLLDLLGLVRRSQPGWTLHLVVPEEGPLVPRARALGVSVHILEMAHATIALGTGGNGRAIRILSAGFATAPYVLRLRRLLEKLGPTVVHSNGVKYHLLSALSGLRVPTIWHVRDFLGARALIGRVLGIASRRCARAIAISKAVAADAAATLRSPRVELVYDAIDTDAFSPGETDPRFLDGGGAGGGASVRVGMVAPYARWKGQDVFIDAIARVRSSDARFYVVGGPIYRTRGSQFSQLELEALAAARGVTDRLRFIPFQDDPVGVFRSLDVVVHSSTSPEPFGRSIVEGMACGKAVVVAAAGGASELFVDGRDAIGVPPRDANALAAALDRLIADRALRHTLGEAARETAVRRFSLPRQEHELGRIYHELAGGAL